MGYTLFPCCSFLSSNPYHGSTGGADQTSMSFLILLDLYSTLIPCALTNAWAQFASSCSDARRDSTSSSRRRRGRLSSRRGSEEVQSHYSGCGSTVLRVDAPTSISAPKPATSDLCCVPFAWNAVVTMVLTPPSFVSPNYQLNLAMYRREEVLYK